MFSILSTASPIGSSLGGYLIVQEPVFHTGEIRNYTFRFIISLAFELVSFFWVYFMINEKVAKEQERVIEMKLQELSDKLDNDGKATTVKLRSESIKKDKHVHPIRLLFDLDNLKAMVNLVIKKRLNKGRTQVISLLLTVITSYIIFSGMFNLALKSNMLALRIGNQNDLGCMMRIGR